MIQRDIINGVLRLTIADTWIEIHPSGITNNNKGIERHYEGITLPEMQAMVDTLEGVLNYWHVPIDEKTEFGRGALLWRKAIEEMAKRN